jgi:hypothetical protein
VPLAACSCLMCLLMLFLAVTLDAFERKYEVGAQLSWLCVCLPSAFWRWPYMCKGISAAGPNVRQGEHCR